MKKQQNTNRSEKIASAVRRYVAEILRDDYADDPEVSRVSIVGAESHGGLQFVRLYYYVGKSPVIGTVACPPRREGAVRESGLGGASSEKINSNTNLKKISKKPPLVADDTATLPPYGGETRLPTIQKRLDTIKSSVRFELGRRMNQRIVPDLQFTYDDTLERGARIDALLEKVVSVSG